MKKLNGNVLAALFTVMVFALCLAVPAVMLGKLPDILSETDPVPTEQLSAERRVELFDMYDSDELTRQALDEEDIDSDILSAAVRRASEVESALVLDAGSQRTLSSTGRNYYTVSDSGDTIRILEYYREWVGDWSNWFLVKLDLDTLDVFYCYYSAACERNLSIYKENSNSTGEALMEQFSGAIGMDGYLVSNVSEDGEQFSICFTGGAGGDERSYDVRAHVYEDTVSLLVDIKMELTG